MSTNAVIVPEKTTVTIVGGGNAAHALAALLPFKKFKTLMYCPFADEAARICSGLEEQGGNMVANFAPHNLVTGRITGKPLKVSKYAKDVIPQADVILMPVPSFAYAPILRDIKPHLRAGQFIGVTPGQGGFDWTAKEVLGEKLLNALNVFAILPMPFNCRVSTFGKCVEVQTFKRNYVVGCSPASGYQRAIALNEAMFGRTESCGNFLSCTLYPINAVIHPARLFTLLAQWYPGQVLAENPLFYEDMTTEAADLMNAINDELIQISDALTKEGIIESRLPHIFDFLAMYVYEADALSLVDFFASNDAYKGFRCPLKQTDGLGKKGEDGWVPDFNSRYFTEDIPFGLCVYKGVADLAGVPTPVIDTVISRFQYHMGKEYLVKGKLVGQDVRETTAPQRFGITTLKQLAQLYRPGTRSSL